MSPEIFANVFAFFFFSLLTTIVQKTAISRSIKTTRKRVERRVNQISATLIERERAKEWRSSPIHHLSIIYPLLRLLHTSATTVLHCIATYCTD
jgi:hypothetical protein